MSLKNRQPGVWDQEAIDIQLVRLAVRRYYASAVNTTRIVDGLPKKRDPATPESFLEDAA